jgi:hypothetical protein
MYMWVHFTRGQGCTGGLYKWGGVQTWVDFPGVQGHRCGCTFHMYKSADGGGLPTCAWCRREWTSHVGKGAHIGRLYTGARLRRCVDFTRGQGSTDVSTLPVGKVAKMCRLYTWTRLQRCVDFTRGPGCKDVSTLHVGKVAQMCRLYP